MWRFVSLFQAHTVYIPRKVFIKNGTENDTMIIDSTDMDIIKSSIDLVRDVQYR